ncbi:hypothetical protein N9K04_05555 [Gammaproteobacteria bacterium]|nr:hypothetical protein [Gammaproteobacteria bacterium]
MNSIYTAEQVRAFEKNLFIKKGDDQRAMMEAAKQSVEILNKDFFNVRVLNSMWARQ